MEDITEDDSMHDTVTFRARSSIDIMFGIMEMLETLRPMSPYTVAIQRSLEDGELKKDDSISLSVCGERYDAEVREISGCSICLDDFSGDDEISTLECGHIFHKDCVVNWGKYRQDCPMCRAKVEYKTLVVEESVVIPGGVSVVAESVVIPGGMSLSDIETVMEHASVPRETAVSALVVEGDVLSAITYLCGIDMVGELNQFPNPVYFMPDLVPMLDDLYIIDDPYEDMPDLEEA
jgi:hypothetical protein